MLMSLKQGLFRFAQTSQTRLWRSVCVEIYCLFIYFLRYIFWLWLISVMPIKIFRSTHLLPCKSFHKKQTAFCISLLSRHSPLSKARSSSDPSLGTRKTSGKIAVTKCSYELTAHTPLKINMEHNHGCLEDHVGSMLIFQGVTGPSKTLTVRTQSFWTM